MEGADLDVRTVRCANFVVDPGLHLLCCLVSKGDCEDLLRFHPVLSDEIGDAVREDSCFAGPWPGDDQERSALMRDCLFLFFVEVV